MAALTHYGWDCSPYSAKTRSYLTWAGVDFDDVHPRAWMLTRTIAGAVGKPIMPTVRWADGHWQQDSSAIIDEVEATRNGPSIHPAGPRQRVASYLVELLADEWLPTVHMHTRWNRPANAAFAFDEFAREGLPFLPRPLAKALIRPIRDRMAGYRAVLGIDEQTAPGIDAFTDELLRALQAHFSEHDWLLGGRPCLGDFALFGPLWAHLYRDPASTGLFDDRPAVVAWMQRLLTKTTTADFLPDDAVPATLEPVLRLTLGEPLAFWRALLGAIEAYVAEHPDAARVPRSLGWLPFSIGGRQGRRKSITATQWKLQRVVDCRAALTGAERATVDAWLADLGGALPDVKHPFVRTDDFRMVLARGS